MNEIYRDERFAGNSACVKDMVPVSVVVPCFRCVDTIGSAVASIAAQTVLPAEVLLVDDYSGDGTLAMLHDIMSSYADGWIKVISMPKNSGPSSARNMGWKQATQAWIAFIDADDTWHPQKLQLQLEVLKADPQIVLLGHRMNVQDRTAPSPTIQYPVKVSIPGRRKILVTNPFPTASVVLRRDLPFRFDEVQWRAEDYLLWAQIVLSGYRAARLNQVLASWHKPPFGAGGLTADLKKMNQAGIEVRNKLHRAGLISWPELQFAKTVGVLKNVRRLLLTRLRKAAAPRYV